MFVGSDKIRYWTTGAVGRRWCDSLLIAAEKVLHAGLKPMAITRRTHRPSPGGHTGHHREDAWAIKTEMEKIAELDKKLFTWLRMSGNGGVCE